MTSTVFASHDGSRDKVMVPKEPYKNFCEAMIRYCCKISAKNLKQLTYNFTVVGTFSSVFEIVMKSLTNCGCSGGVVVSILAFYSRDPSLNPAGK